MSKTSLTPAQETELVTAGQPSKLLLTKLRQIGASIDDAQIIKALGEVEESRALFQSHAIEAGLLLLAKKQTVKHGQWGKWCDSLASKSATVADLKLSSVRSIQRYTFIAQHFIADLEQGNLGEMPDDAMTVPMVDPSEVIALEILTPDRRADITNQIGRWVRSRSLRQLLADLRRADNAAAEEETTENPPKPQRTIKGRAGDHAAADLPPPIALNAEQLQLWQDVAFPLQALDTLINDDTAFLSTDRDFWKAVVMSLDARLAAAKERLSHVG